MAGALFYCRLDVRHRPLSVRHLAGRPEPLPGARDRQAAWPAVRPAAAGGRGRAAAQVRAVLQVLRQRGQAQAAHGRPQRGGRQAAAVQRVRQEVPQQQRPGWSCQGNAAKAEAAPGCWSNSGDH